MASTSETGNAKNIANLKLLNTNIAALGTAYNPTNTKIKLTQLDTLYTTAYNQQKAVNDLSPIYSNAVVQREVTYKPLNRLVTKLRKTYKSTDNIQLAQLENFMTIARKIKGHRKTKKRQYQRTKTSIQYHSLVMTSEPIIFQNS